jgi:branched-chain amino acid transport system substrate-binding protein
MNPMSRRRFLQLSAMAGGAWTLSELADRALRLSFQESIAYAAEPIKIGIVDPLSIP